MLRTKPQLFRSFYIVRKVIHPVSKCKIIHKIPPVEKKPCIEITKNTFLNRLCINAVKMYLVSYCVLFCTASLTVFFGIGYVVSDILKPTRVYMWKDRNDD